MTGIVCIWPGTIATIPAGWLLCDGTDGTPDMRGYVAIGARDGFDAGAVLGASTHIHPFDVVSGLNVQDHTHEFYVNSLETNPNSNDVTNIGGSYSPYALHSHIISGTTATNNVKHSHVVDGVTLAGDSKQLSRELLFIMKA